MQIRAKLLLSAVALLVALKAGVYLERATRPPVEPEIITIPGPPTPGCHYSDKPLRIWPRPNLMDPELDELQL